MEEENKKIDNKIQEDAESKSDSNPSSPEEDESKTDFKWVFLIIVSFILILILFIKIVVPALQPSSHAPSDLLDPSKYEERRDIYGR